MADEPAAKPAPTDTAASDIDDIALQRAASIVAAAAADPVRLAQQFLEWQNAVKGAHALMHAIVKKYIGPGVVVTVPRAEWQAPDMSEELITGVLPNGDATLVLRTKNRAERRRGRN